jgi:hypothetical protein
VYRWFITTDQVPMPYTTADEALAELRRRASAFFGRAFTVAGAERTFCDAAALAPLSPADQRNLRRAIWSIAGRARLDDSWSQAIWRALRWVCECPAPMPLQARHRPIIAAELRRVMIVTRTYQDHVVLLEREIARRVLRQGEDLAWMVGRIAAAEAAWLAEAEARTAKLAEWAFEDIDRFERADYRFTLEHEEYAEQIGGAA